jgi:hypothetical protein
VGRPPDRLFRGTPNTRQCRIPAEVDRHHIRYRFGASGADGGTDTFFADGRAGQSTWDTLLNFHDDMLAQQQN